MASRKKTIFLFISFWPLLFCIAGELFARDISTVLITGANRGLGLEFTRQYAAKGWIVIATARQPEAADELNSLAAKSPRVRVEAMDVTDEISIKALR